MSGVAVMPRVKKPKAKVISSKTPDNTPGQSDDAISLILPYIYIGPVSATSARSTFITRQGITHVVSVGKRPNSTLQKVSYLRLSIDDDPSANLRKVCGEAVAFIDKARMEEESKILVHCSAGISRSPSVVAFYLMKRCDMSLKLALGLIFRARPNACPNHGFVVQLQQAELELWGISSLPPDLMFLPTKIEDRLALCQEDQLPHAHESSQGYPNPKSSQVSHNEENALDKFAVCD